MLCPMITSAVNGTGQSFTRLSSRSANARPFEQLVASVRAERVMGHRLLGHLFRKGSTPRAT